MREEGGAFKVKDCALIAIATGRRAQNLKELREHLSRVEASSLYAHFWGGLLQPRFEEREFSNDFAAWVRHALHDKVLAERLAVVDPARLSGLEALRDELLELVDDRLDETESLTWTPSDQQFEFVRSQMVVFNTRRFVEAPAELGAALARLSNGSVFYHFIDARRRRPDHLDDFRAWLARWGSRHEELIRDIAAVDPCLVSLPELRGELAGVVDRYFRTERYEEPA